MESQREVHDLFTTGSYRKEMEIRPMMEKKKLTYLATLERIHDSFRKSLCLRPLKSQREVSSRVFFIGGKMESQREVHDLFTTGSYRKEMEIRPMRFSSLLFPVQLKSPREMEKKKQTYWTTIEDIDDDKSGKSLTLNEEIAFEKQRRFDQNHYPSHGTKFMKRTLGLFIFLLQCAGGTVLGNSQQESQALPDIYQSTLAEVSYCPTRIDFDERSYNRCGKVCEIHMQDGSCAYHCMRDSLKTRLVEFCAKPKLLFTYCPEYDQVDQTIQKDEDTLCNSTSSTIFFPSSDIFFCDPNSCFQINEPTVRTDATTLTTLTTKPFVRNSGKSQQTLCTGLLVFVVMTMYM